MESVSISMFCSECETRLKRQVMGSNVFYYCRSCGRMISDTCLSGKNEMLRIQEPLSAQRISTVKDLELSEGSQKVIVES